MLRPSRRSRASCLLALVLALPVGAQQREVTPDSLAARALVPVRVTGRADNLVGEARSASEGRVGRAELAMRPLLREGELLETVPGMIVTQHSGDGKANQLFVRGFNRDHGTDFSTRVDGVPLNMPSHAHGQGYTDLNFLIPETVDHLDYHLGVQHAAIGDFGSAGGAEFHLARAFERSFASVEGGQFGFARLVSGGSARVGPGILLAAGELKGYDGPWARAEQLRKASGLLRYAWGSPASQWSVTAMSYANRWNASDQIPLRAVLDGAIGAFGQVDSTLGGAAERHALSATWRGIGAGVTTVSGYVVESALDLYSNFTYGLADTATGDQFNQREHRVTTGVGATHAREFITGSVTHAFTVGLDERTDLVRGVGLYRTRARQRLATVRVDDVTQSSLGAFAELETRWTPWLRSTVGLRGDGGWFDVASDDPRNGGARRAAIASPKLSVAVQPAEGLELYAGAGMGFHSNDARGMTLTVDPATGNAASAVTPFVRSRGAEVGARLSSRSGWRATLAAWTLALDSELLFSGDGGTTEPAAASGRTGVTFAAYWRPASTVALDLDASVARARFTGVPADSQSIPGALEHVIAAGVTLGRASGGPFAAVRLRHFGAYALEETNRVRAQPSTLVNAEVGLSWGAARVTVSVLNLLDASARDVQYFYASRLTGEPAAGVDDVHFHPAEPRQVRVCGAPRRSRPVIERPVPPAEPRCGLDRPVHERERRVHGIAERLAEREPRRDRGAQRAPGAVRVGRLDPLARPPLLVRPVIEHVHHQRPLAAAQVAALHQRRGGAVLVHEPACRRRHRVGREHGLADEQRRLVQVGRDHGRQREQLAHDGRHRALREQRVAARRHHDGVQHVRREHVRADPRRHRRDHALVGQHAALERGGAQVARHGVQLCAHQVRVHRGPAAHPARVLRGDRRDHARAERAEPVEGLEVRLDPRAAPRVRAGDRERDRGRHAARRRAPVRCDAREERARAACVTCRPGSVAAT
ncbi:MAG: TonB-dependent receptor [Gemmatimonadetes bacterium]|nr:TonB-dependent receptor [Gemmatimonadota bacterium]